MIKNIHIQVLVLGSGPAGYSAAFRSSDLGLSTILVEKYDNLGGVCLNVGCIPSKFLLHIAKVIRETQEISTKGVYFDSPKIDLQKIKFYKNKIISDLSTGLSNMAKNRNIITLSGISAFIDTNVISVTNKTGITHVHFEDVIIATGSKPINLFNMDFDKQYIWSSTQALSLHNIPKRLLIIGSGVIGLEMATFYSAIGTKVDVIDRCNQVLSVLDKNSINFFMQSVKNYFNILLNTTVENITIKNNTVIVKLCINGNLKEKKYDSVLVAIGRYPNIKELNLKRIGINIDKNNFIQTDNQLKTNIPHVYAIGDVIGPPMLAHKGIHQGHVAAEVIAGYNHCFDPMVIPSVAYTDPEIAWVGMSEFEASTKNINYEVSVFPWKASGRALVSHCSNGMTKLIINKDNNKVLGGIIIGRNAGELLSEITLAIEMGCDIEDISLTIHPHPTLSESIGLSAQIFTGTITDLINLKTVLRN